MCLPPGTPLQRTLRADGLWITIVTNAATWNALFKASQLEVAAVPGVIRLQQREDWAFRE